jgi:5'-deoxynucleotidase YfbR-like HD superfamily hydrolase
MSKKIQKEIEGVYDFMSKVYFGNWQYRFSGTPHMSNANKTKKKESILAHELACIGFWFNMRRVCPNLDRLIDSTRIYEIFFSHDLGEILGEEISLSRQIKGKGKNKEVLERKEIVKLAKKAPKKIVKDILQNFDIFEEKIEKITDLEILVCKLIDNTQGNHFAISFGNDFKKHKEHIKKIFDFSFFKRRDRLLQVLKERGHKKAYKEVEIFSKHILELYRNKGVE